MTSNHRFAKNTAAYQSEERQIQKLQGNPFSGPETLIHYSDKQSIRSNQGSEMSGVAQNLHSFLQNNMVIMAPTRVGLFDAQPSTISSGNEAGRLSHRFQNTQRPHVIMNHDLMDSEGDIGIVHYPLKRANSTLDAIGYCEIAPPTYHSERSGSTKPPASKQVRFDIKESLKHLINSTTEGSNEHINDENDPYTANHTQNDRRMTRTQMPPRAAKLKFKRGENKKSGSRSSHEQSLGSKNQEAAITGERNNKNTVDQKPIKNMHAKVTKQLALKYKKNADQMKFKKFGIQPPSQYPDESTYSTIEGPKKINEDDSRETPNFSMAHSNRDILDDRSSPDRAEEQIPIPVQMDVLQIMNIPQSLEFEEINHHYNNRPPQIFIDTEKSIGTIVKSRQVAPPVEIKTQQQKLRENSTNSSRMSSYQPGVIVRQRSQSPASSFQLSNLAFQAKDKNKGQMVGQIVRNNSQKSLQPNQSLPHVPQYHIATSPDKEKSNQKTFNYLQINDSQRKYDSQSQAINLQDNPSYPASTTLTDSNSYQFKNHFFGTVWDQFLSVPPSEARFKLMQLTDQSAQLHTQLLSALSHPGIPPHLKLQCLRRSLPQLVFSTLSEDLELLIYLLERRTHRLLDLKTAALKPTMSHPSSTTSQYDTLKVELLRDICDRLSQKMCLLVLKINSQLRREMRTRFEVYSREYIDRDCYLRRAIACMKEQMDKNRSKREYVNSLRDEMRQMRKRQLLVAWSKVRIKRLSIESKYEKAIEVQDKQIQKRSLRAWKLFIKQQKIKNFNQALCEIYSEHKFKLLLFLKWVYQRRSHSKIKRKALQILAHNDDHRGIATLSDDQWFQQANLTRQKSFQSDIKHLLQERKTLIKPQIINPPNFIHKPLTTQYISSASQIQRRVNPHQVQIIDQNIDIRRSMDFDLKYKIHSALVMQQNSHNKQRPLSLQREPLISRKQLNFQSFVSDGENFHLNDQTSRSQSRGPQNKFFKILQNKNQPQVQQKLVKQAINYDKSSGLNLIEQLTNNALELKNSSSGANLGYNYHFVTSLRANALDVLNPDAFQGLTDYIQYGLASRCNKLVFQRLFKTKAMSILFQQWRARYNEKHYKRSITNIHTAHLAKQVMIEWHRQIQQRKLWVREFQRTKFIERQYKIFQKWSAWNRDTVCQQKRRCLLLKKRQLFQAWVKYMNRQGNQLLKIIRAQSYYKQSLLSRSLVALYQYNLKQLRAKRLQRTIVFKKYFKALWTKAFKKQSLLRKLVNRISHKQELSERLKYQIEYESKKKVMEEWHERAVEKRENVKQIIAETHYWQGLVIKTFFNMKRLSQQAQGLRKLNGLFKFARLQPTFQKLCQTSNELLSSETNFKRYRTSFNLTRIFIGWKEHTIRNKLARLFFQKRVLKHLYTYVMRRNHILPAQYRGHRLQALFMSQLTQDVRARWTVKRSDIILRQLQQKRQERVVRVCFLNLLENVMSHRQQRLIQETVTQFRRDRLSEKAWRVMKRRWLQRKRDRLMLQVASDFNQQREQKKTEEMKESLLSSTNDFEIVRLRDHQVFEDPVKMLKYRVLSSWKMYIFERFRRDTVLDRYLLFKRRMLSLRCFLAWRSVAKYEQSPSIGESGISSAVQKGKNNQGQQRRMPSVSEYVTREHSPKRGYESQSIEVIGGSVSQRGHGDSRKFLFDHQVAQNRLGSQQESIGQAASATFGIRSIGSNYDSINGKKLPQLIDGDTPRDCQLRSTSLLKEDKQFNGTSSLFDELEGIFQKNRKWLDEQREREEFLREMASHYNQQLSLEMNSLRYSHDKYPSITTSVASRRQ